MRISFHRDSVVNCMAHKDLGEDFYRVCAKVQRYRRPQTMQAVVAEPKQQ